MIATHLTSCKCPLASGLRVPSAAGAERRAVAVRAQQAPDNLASRAVAGLAAAQVALLPFAAPALAEAWAPSADASLQHEVGFLGLGNKKTNKGFASLALFNADGVKQGRQELEKNLDNAVAQRSDPVAKVVPASKPDAGSEQDAAESVRQQAENAKTPGGDARAPTNKRTD